MEGNLTVHSQQDFAEHVLFDHEQGDHRVHTQDLQDLTDLHGSFILAPEQRGLTLEEKQILSKLYKIGRKEVLISSHIKFLKICKVKDLMPNGLEIPKVNIEKEVIEKVKDIEKIQLVIKLKKFECELNKVVEKRKEIIDTIEDIFNCEEKDSLMNKFDQTNKKWRKIVSMKKKRKVNNLLKTKNEGTKNFVVEEQFGEFWRQVLKRKTRRKISKKRLKAKKSSKEKRRRRNNAQISSLDENNNNIDDDTSEEMVREFLNWATEEKVIKVKNLSKDPIPPEIEAFLSLGPKACPVELDVNIARLDGDIHAFIRRIRLVKMFKDDKDKRDEEEKRFYTKNPDFVPDAGKSAPLDMFAYKLLNYWNNWKQKRRTPDNLTMMERQGKGMINSDLENHVYRLEDKGSCIVRLDMDDYENNAIDNLENTTVYEVVDEDPEIVVNEIKNSVKDQVDKMISNGELKDKTAEYILDGGDNPGVYYENIKTHKMTENHNMSGGFPSRGIMSVRNTAIERLGDYVDFKVNKGMQQLTTFLKDTRSLLIMIDQKNESGPIPDSVNWLSADMKNMYQNMPGEESEAGCREYLDRRDVAVGEATTNSIIECLNICQDNNVFVFLDKLYRQVSGHATGQKQAPSVACQGAGRVERRALNTPRDIVFNNNQTGRILSVDKDDPIFWSVRDLLDWFKRYIDDVLCLFRGNLQQAKWFINVLNSICPGRVEFTFEFSTKTIVFLNTRLILNRETKQIDVDYYVKPTNQQLFLHYRSCHPEHVFRATVYNQAILGKTVCSYTDWCERYMQILRVKFLAQEYPENLIDEQFDKVRNLTRNDLLYKKKDKKKENQKAKEMRSCMVVTYNPGNPPLYKWINSILNVLHEDPEMKDLCPRIPIVTRQPPSVASFAIKSKHWQTQPRQAQEVRPPGCHRLHGEKSCVCCARMKEVTDKVRSCNTGREYTIRRHYNCQSSWVIYCVTCLECQVQYIGQTIQTMVARHYGHRNEVRNGLDGIGRHFKEKHGQGLDLFSKTDLAKCLQSFDLQVIASVKPPATTEEERSCRQRLDNLEADMQHRLRCMQESGGMNIRDENLRRRNH